MNRSQNLAFKWSIQTHAENQKGGCTGCTHFFLWLSRTNFFTSPGFDSGSVGSHPSSFFFPPLQEDRCCLGFLGGPLLPYRLQRMFGMFKPRITGAFLPGSKAGTEGSSKRRSRGVSLLSTQVASEAPVGNMKPYGILRCPMAVGRKRASFFGWLKRNHSQEVRHWAIGDTNKVDFDHPHV